MKTKADIQAENDRLRRLLVDILDTSNRDFLSATDTLKAVNEIRRITREALAGPYREETPC